MISFITTFKNSRNLTVLFVLSIFLILICTRQKNSVSTENSNPPSFHFTNPSNDTTIITDDSIASYRLRGIVNVSDGLTLTVFKINDKNFLDSVSTYPYEFAVTVSLVSDTNRFIFVATDSKNKSTTDTLKIFKVKKPIPASEAILTGTLYRPSSSPMAKKLTKKMLAMNAAGLSANVDKVLPLTGADVLVYCADSVSTSSIASTKTDSTGNWKVNVPPGNYFIFAVWFDQENLELITAALQNVKAEGGKINPTEEKIALSDDIPPVIVSILDAEAPDEKNLFLASNLAEGLPVIITFSEPMNRLSVGEDTNGIILGEIDVDDITLTLKSKIPIKKLWNANGKELRLIPQSPLTAGKYYKVIIPESVKDLALNKIKTTYSGIFSVVKRSDIEPFSIKGATIKNNDTIATEKIIEIIFSRPVDGVVLNRYSTITPQCNFFFDMKGMVARLSFPTPQQGLKPNTTYTLAISRSVRDLLGDSLGSDFSLSFTTTGELFQGDSSSIKAKLSSFVVTTLEAFVSQDIERFSQSLHPLLEVTEIVNKDGKEESYNQNIDKFLEARRSDVALIKRMSVEGVLFPKIYKKVIGKDTIAFRKLVGKAMVGTAPIGKYCFIEDVGTGGFKQPLVLDSNENPISSQVEFRGDTLIVDGYSFIINIPFNFGFIDPSVADKDPGYYGKLQEEKTNIEMQRVKIDIKYSYSIRMIDTLRWTGDKKSADVLVDLIRTESQSTDANLLHTNVIAIKLTIVEENSRLLVRWLVTKEVFSGANEEFKQKKSDILNEQNLNINDANIQRTIGIELYMPPQKAVKVTTPVIFRWQKVEKVKSYIFCISDEISGGSSGLLVFTYDTTITVGEDGSIDGGTVLTIEPSRLNVPIPRFTNRLSKLDPQKVYAWKIIGIPDTTPSTITGQLMVIADSDFRPSRQLGYFTLASTMPDLSNIIQNQGNVTPESKDFVDSDNDGWADWLEKAIGTNPFDKASRPEFAIDSDKDGIADFFEAMFKTNPEDAASKPEDANKNHIPDDVEKLSTWDNRLLKDSDGDSWPDEIEIGLRCDPWNQNSVPAIFSRGAAPIGNYRGKIYIQIDNKEYNIAISITADSTGIASAIIDSTTLNILRTGEILPCRFEFGEWVFYSKMIAGLNVNKYLKFRAIPSFQQLEGNIDMSDNIGGGGPLVGRFKVRTDGNVESAVNKGGEPNNQLREIGPPPVDLVNSLKILPPNAKPFKLSIGKTSNDGKLSVNFITEALQMTSIEAIWQPQMSPRYIFKFQNDSLGEIRIEGDIFKDASAIYLGGVVFVKMKQSFEFFVSASNAKIEDPVGVTWEGFIKEAEVKSNIPSDGFLAYIGPRANLESALNNTSKKGMTLDSNTIIIGEFWQEGIWRCKDSSGNIYQILEKPGDPQNVFVGKDRSGTDVIMLRKEGGATGGGGGGNNNQQGAIPFKGSRQDIIGVLIMSEMKVKVRGTDNTIVFEREVDTTTLVKVPDSKVGDSVYQINDRKEPEKRYIFISEPQSGKLLLIENKPVVIEIGNAGPKVQPYRGELSIVADKLSSSNNQVQLLDMQNGNLTTTTVDPATLKSVADPKNAEMILIIAKINDSGKNIIFTATPDNAMNLNIDPKNNLPVVVDAPPEVK